MRGISQSYWSKSNESWRTRVDADGARSSGSMGRWTLLEIQSAAVGD